MNGGVVGPLAQADLVMLRHYGPVTWTSGLMPVTVEYFDGSAWQDITDDFQAVAGATPRDVVIEAMTSLDFDEDVTYRITPIRANPGTGRTILKCSGVTGQPPVADYEYRLNW